MRPNFFVNTPDILHEYLQYGGPRAFRIRAVARRALSSPTWGVYSGFELFEHVAVRPGSEEYLDSEKYQLPAAGLRRRRAAGNSLAPYLAMLNRIRREHPALQRLRKLHVHTCRRPEQVICFSQARSRRRRHRHRRRQPRPARRPRGDGASGPARPRPRSGETFDVVDELTGASYTWGEHNYVRLDPSRAGARPQRAAVQPQWPRTSSPRMPSTDSARSNRATRTGSSAPSSTRSSSAASPTRNGDGTGDLRGLTAKLDYLQWLGRRLPLAAAVLRLAAARRRLRRQRLLPACCPSSATSTTSSTCSSRRTRAASG